MKWENDTVPQGKQAVMMENIIPTVAIPPNTSYLFSSQEVFVS